MGFTVVLIYTVHVHVHTYTCTYTNVLCKSFFYVDYLEWVHNLQLSMAEKEVLTSGGLLTANHISAANMLLKTQFPLQNGLKDTHYLAAKNQWDSNPQDFVQIIFITPGHWACLSNKFSTGNSVDLYDSMYTMPCKTGTILKQACCIMRSVSNGQSSITINVIRVTPQVGGADCGLFAISMAHDLCSGVDPFSQRAVQDQMRPHLLQCFEKLEISPFPNVPRKGLHAMNRVIKSVSFKIYCVCRGPSSRPMASCDICLEWFHPSCVTIPEEVFINEDIEWICPSCESTFVHVFFSAYNLHLYACLSGIEFQA